MTIRGNRTAAAAVAGMSAFLDVVLGAAGVLLQQPGLTLLVGLVVAAEIVGVLSLLQPVSLSLVGDEILYRRGGREKHISRSDVTVCKQSGAAWIFSNSVGAQLVSVLSLRFSETDIAAFCSHAGINLTGAMQFPVDRLRRDVGSGKANRAWGVFFAVLFLAGSGGLFYWQQRVQDDLRRYQAAPSCTQAAPNITACRLQTQARVTSVDARQKDVTLHLSLVPSGGDYVATVDYPGPGAGDTVELEVWKGEVTRVNGRDTAGNPARDPNLHLNGAILVPAVFALIGVVLAGIGQYQLTTARSRLRLAIAAEGLASGPVAKVHVDTTTHGVALPPCGILHQPKEQFFAHQNPRTVKQGMVVVSVIAAVILAGLVALAIYVSLPIFGGIAVLGLAWFAIQLIAGWREIRWAGIFADDLHVGRLTTDWIGRFDRKVYDRKSVLEVVIDGPKISVVGTDGSTLFWTSLISPDDMARYGRFLGVRVVRQLPEEQPDSVAVSPVQTPVGVLPLKVRRAAGVMQSLGGLCVGLAGVNLMQLAGVPAGRRLALLEMLGVLAVYGAVFVGLGLLLARGRPHSRELALFGGGAATALFAVFFFVASGNPTVAALVAVCVVPFYAMAVYWLRTPSQSRP